MAANKSKWFLKQTTDQLKDVTFNKLEKFGDILKEEINDGAPGRIKAVVRVSRIRQNVTVGATHPVENVPVFVEFGTPPHWIEPVNAEALHWVTDSGEDAFSKGHMHPGTAPNPFMRRGIARATFRVQELKG